MKIKTFQVVIVAFTPVLLFGFQNCSKLGTNGIAVSDQNLSFNSVEVTAPVSGVDDINEDHGDGEINDNNGSNEPVTAPAEIEDDEVADATRVCESQELLLESATDLDLAFNHESVKVDAQKVISLKGNYGSYVLVRAKESSSTANSIHINHTTLILCKFAQIESLKGTYNRVIIVGGNIQELRLNNSTVALVNASVNDAHGANTVIKNYSSK